MLVVWEPILASDWSPPISGVLRRTPDQRVAQFWDHDHLVATQMARDAREPQPKQDCCVTKGHLWDLAAVYPPSAPWTEKMPTAMVFNGPVVDAVEAMVEALTGKNPKR